jgi:hypothetical protein
MAFERPRWAAVVGALLLALAVPATAQTVAYPNVDASQMTRNVNTPEPTLWRPNEAEQSVPLELLSRLRDALALERPAEAYGLYHQEFRAENTLEAYSAEDRRWAIGRITLTRQTWYPQPAGQPHNLYVAFDLISRVDDGTYVCGYVLMSRIGPGGSAFKVLRTEMTYIDRGLIDGDLPRPEIAAQANCWLGEDVQTQLNP